MWAQKNGSWDGIARDSECQKALVAKLLGYLLILGSFTVKAPQVCSWSCFLIAYIPFVACYIE